MKIYTKTGDRGDTGLFGGGRVRKDDPRVEAYGTVDELNAVLGLVRAYELPAPMDQHVERLQNELFELGAELATPDAVRRGMHAATPAKIATLEAEIDHYEEQLPPLRQFILPGGTLAAAGLHLARTVCRRAERLVVTLADDDAQQVSADLIVYLNRLSDLLFVLARAANQARGRGDEPWQKPA